MITHEDVAVAHQRAQELQQAVRASLQRASNTDAPVFTRAYAEAKRQEAREAMVSAAAQARWASWPTLGLMPLVELRAPR